MTLGGLALLASQWHETARFPKLMLPGLAMMLYFVATGIPQTMNSYQWASGNVGAARWIAALQERGEAGEIAPNLIGTWKSGHGAFSIERDSLTVTSQGKTEILGAAHCPDGFLLKFAYATESTLHFNPAAAEYYKLLDGPPVPSLEVACHGRLYTFLLRADGTSIAFRDLHQRDPAIAVLTR